jgi:signal transduction histidine kinase
MLRLYVLQGVDQGKVYVTRQTAVGIGTAPENEVQFSDPFVSRHHGRLTFAAGRWMYRDLGSTNGSIIDRSGERIPLGRADAEVELEADDLIVVGQSVLRCCVPDAQERATLDRTLIASRNIEDLDAVRQQQLGSYDDLSLAYQLEQNIGVAFEPESMLDAILEAMLGAFPSATHVILVLVDKETLRIKRQVARAKGTEGRIEEGLAVSMSVVKRVIREGKAVLFTNAPVEFRDSESVAAMGLESSLCAPLWTGEETLGLIQVESRGRPASFTERDLDRLCVFANRVATAIIGCELCEAERRNRLLQDLAAMVTHDLKGPLTSIIGFLELLSRDREQLEDRYREYVEESLVASKWLAMLIGAILDAAKLEAGELKPMPGLLAIREEVDQALSLISYQMREKDIHLVTALRDDLPPISADRELFRRIIINLAGNSVALSPPGSTVTVSGTVTDKSDAVVVSVQDQGPGIPRDYQSRIFDKFFQAEKREHSREKLSVGLGLAFCKLAVEAHGGTIWVDSEVGGGCRFSFSLPVGPGIPPLAQKRAEQSGGRAAGKPDGSAQV